MRVRDRLRVEKRTREIIKLVEPKLLKKLRIIWCRRLPCDHKDYLTHAIVDAQVPWIFFDEYVHGISSKEENEDTIRHEIAHLMAYFKYGRDIPDHGKEFRAARRRVEKVLGKK